jgi:hypothetical protein
METGRSPVISEHDATKSAISFNENKKESMPRAY